jgi:hypothetical protein
VFRLDEELPVWLHRAAIDLRKNINGLAALVQYGMASGFLYPVQKPMFLWLHSGYTQSAQKAKSPANRAKCLIYLG